MCTVVSEIQLAPKFNNVLAFMFLSNIGETTIYDHDFL
jgi:hypothetical protein